MLKPGSVKVSSSPGREKLPPTPGLARLLYGKTVGSRSRGRSVSGAAARSSPMFVSRSRSRGRAAGTGAAAEEGEPSSPKVTCIGQVRIRNKKRATPGKQRNATSPKKRRRGSCLVSCHCFHKAFLCVVFKTPPGGGGGLRRWLWRRRWGGVRSGRSGRYQERKKPDPVKSPPLPEFVTCATKESDQEDSGEEKEERAAAACEEEPRASLSSETASSPPKNALLLMRCRSAPHNRASSLATARFALPPAEEFVQQPAAGEEPAQEAEAEAEAEEDHQVEDEAKGSESQRPLVLPRSKSEPARRAAAKLAIPEAASCFWPSHVNVSRRRRSSPNHGSSPPL
ncbi:uncharacterized protein LOC121976208 [Zingiber officinale]|uniref:Uncharacterized protein n=1 Tax=Zingiber officinale TaxID=94328 RepID=A0A8J5H8S7_ZINOF|nr:uncharacterized protein LOC121976208 [Zingiber officinale]KAG6511920.1 hypothetical protein ZIOFF_029999 [Zingiber officinale]